MRPHRQQPTRLPCPWDSPGKNTGVGCHFLLQCMKVKNESEVAQSCPTLSDQAPPSMAFSRQEYWSGVPLPSPPFWTPFPYSTYLTKQWPKMAAQLQSSGLHSSLQKGGNAGARGACQLVIGGVTLFFRSNQAALRPLALHNCKEAQETGFFFFFFFFFFSFSG